MVKTNPQSGPALEFRRLVPTATSAAFPSFPPPPFICSFLLSPTTLPALGLITQSLVPIHPDFPLLLSPCSLSSSPRPPLLQWLLSWCLLFFFFLSFSNSHPDPRPGRHGMVCFVFPFALARAGHGMAWGGLGSPSRGPPVSPTFIWNVK